MSSFYFSSVPRLKIRRSGVVDAISPPPLVHSAVSVLGVTVLQTPETMVGIPSSILFVPKITSEMPSVPSPVGSVSSSEGFQKLGKRKAGTDSRGEAFRTPVPPPAGNHEHINTGPYRDELDPTVLGKLPTPAAITAASIHKYWTSAFGKAANNTELTELLKLAEMYTSRSRVLNCKLYKVLAMKIDELRTTVGRNEYVNVLRSENKDLRE
ncbi:hypothetical protein Fot_47468 [Forsythia ovata]|uniref:Uncharacterized protein n=1 Tax=Forsythia ovata TaxID=205694 RepID=A0ABD1QRC1_9LAMI